MRIRRKRLFLPILTIGLFSFTLGAEAAGATINPDPGAPDSVSSDGLCSLREAIISANKDRDSTGDCESGNGADTIVLEASAVYTLTKDDNGRENSSSSGDLDITDDLTIQGSNATITGAAGFRNRIIQVIGGNVLIQDVTISGGGPRREAGGILNQANLMLERVTVSSNVAGGSGGGILNEGILDIRDSTVSENLSGGDGGAIANSGTLNLANVTVSGNLAEGNGGGLFNSAGSAAFNNATIAYNTADSDNKQGGDGGGLARAGGTLTIGNTIMGANSDSSAGGEAPDCSGSIESAGFNLIQDSNGCDVSGTTDGNLIGVDPLLRSLGDYGGPTFTHALSGASPAIDGGNPGAPAAGGPTCEPADQRGLPRPRGFACDIGALEADVSDPLVLIRAFGNQIEGRLAGPANTDFTIEFFIADDCDPPLAGQTMLGSIVVSTDDRGDVYFQATLNSSTNINDLVVGTTSLQGTQVQVTSACIVSGYGNDSWPRALPLSPGGNPLSVNHQQILGTFGQSLWYKFSVEPGSQLIVTLTDLPANYDLTVYKDIAAAYDELAGTEDLERLSAEFAPSAFSPSAFSPSAFSPSAFSPSAFSPSAFSPSAFSPSAFSPSAFSPSAFSPSAFSPSAFSPSAFSPSAFSPDAFSPSAFSPSAFSPSAFSPSAFSPSAFSPSAFSPSAFSGAQMQSLVGVSAFDGTAGEGLVLNSWNNIGDFYVRVRGREGAFSLDAPFKLGIVVQPGTCGSVSAALGPTSLTAAGTDFRTVILTDLARMPGSAADKSLLLSRLNTLAGRSEVNGVVVDVGSDARVSAANDQADANLPCPYAKNLVADAIRQIVTLYRNPNLQYLVLVGSDDVIPFFRHPDEAYLGPEKQYVPPVLDNTASQASLRLNYVLSQDDYAANFSVSFGSDAIPVPDLSIGRLVETAAEATGMVDAYLATDKGVVPTPTSSLVTGYDFLQDAADAIQDELVLGMGVGAQTDTLIAPNNISPEDPDAWNAGDLAAEFLDTDRDLVFLAGHFNASSTLAADFRTNLTTLDLLDSSVDLVNSIIFSVGCHSAYNIVDADGVPGVTFEPDWSQAFSRKKATFIGGTGYQYGDTEFIEYSERLYLEFARQLRAGSGPVSVGDALVAAKQIYLANTPQLRGIHGKTFMEATLYGLPMLSVDMPGERYNPPGLSPVIDTTLPVTTDPGSTLGLTVADLTVSPTLTDHTLELTNYDDNSTVDAFYLSGFDGVLTNPAEPALPLELRNVSADGTSLRGVGFLGGSYIDLQNILPLTGAPTTEIRGVHTPFQTSVFYPVRPWGVNYFDALSNGGGGSTRLAVTPAQFKSSVTDPEVGTLRKFARMDFRLYYSAFSDATQQNGLSALAAPPTIVSVASSVNGLRIDFGVYVVDNPAAGIQEVWATYTDTSNPAGGTWVSVNLSQNSIESTLWEGTLTLPGGSSPANLRFVVQATNGLGLVTMATNLGSYYIPGANVGQGAPTSLVLSVDPASGGDYGTQVEVSATLTDGGSGTGGKVVTFYLGSVGRVAITDAAGQATTTLPVFALPGNNEVTAFFAGDADFAPSGSSSPFAISKRDTQISMVDPSPPGGFAADSILIEATLLEANPSGRTLIEQTMIFNVTGDRGTYSTAIITDYLGRARLGELPLPPGDYTVSAYFSGNEHGLGFSQTDDQYNPAFASIEVTLTNTKPLGQPDDYVLDEDTVFTAIVDELQNIDEGVLDNDKDIDDQPLTAILETGVANGSVGLNSNGSFTYTPNANFNGADSFTYFANDGIDNSDAVTVSLTVNPVNDAPVAVDDAYTVAEDNLLPVAASGVLGNDSDVDVDPLSAVLVPATGPANGTLLLNADGSFDYTPDPNFNGTDSFKYVANDGTVDSAPATVTITVNSVNDAPVAVDDPYSTPEDIQLNVAAPGILGNDDDVEGDAALSVITPVMNGTLTLNADGSFSYNPDANFNGQDSFTYDLSDQDGGSTATVIIEVTPVNDPPDCSEVITDILFMWPPDGKMETVTLSGWTDPDGDGTAVLTITDVYQDEPLTRRFDAQFTNTPNVVKLRVDRDGSQDGRVYHIFWVVDDGQGGTCGDEYSVADPADAIIRVPVNHDNSDIDFIDQGPLVNSIPE